LNYFASLKGYDKDMIKLRIMEAALIPLDEKYGNANTTVELLAVRTSIMSINEDADSFVNYDNPDFSIDLADMAKDIIKKASPMVLAALSESAYMLEKREHVIGCCRTMLDSMTGWKPNRVRIANTTLSDVEIANAAELVRLAGELKILTELASKPLIHTASSTSKVQRVAKMRECDYDAATKVSAALAFDLHVQTPGHEKYVTRKVDSTKVLHVDILNKAENGPKVNNWIAAQKLLFQNQMSVNQPNSGITQIAFGINHFGEEAANWWLSLKIPSWHPLRQDQLLFWKFVRGDLTPNDADETSYKDFLACHYRDCLNFEGWQGKLKHFLKLNEDAEQIWNLSKVIVYKHVVEGSPLEIRKAFLQAKCDENTSVQELMVIAKSTEDLHEQLTDSASASQYFIGNVNQRNQSRGTPRPVLQRRQYRRGVNQGRLYVLGNEEENEETESYELDDEQLEEQQQLLCAIAASNAKKNIGVEEGQETRVCFKCGVAGHISVNCPEKTGANGGSAGTTQSSGPGFRPSPPRAQNPYRPPSGFANPAYRSQRDLVPQSWNKPKPFGQRIFYKKADGRVAVCTEAEEDRILGGEEVAQMLLIKDDHSGSLFVLA